MTNTYKYPKLKYELECEGAPLLPGRVRDKVIFVPRHLPCNTILVHGVNDVGTGYQEVEEGLCEGLGNRLSRRFKAAKYRMPGNEDKKKVEDDPDAIFYKREIEKDTDSSIIPFYWGYREIKNMTQNANGQKTDRYGTRLDKDLSMGGGPFGNATSNLPDMWNRGTSPAMDLLRDPLRRLKTGPGRLYMVLAAQRLAALVSMIRQYEPNDTVNIVAHSQGCLLTLLAQAFLMERDERTADTLILNNPPYSLDEDMSLFTRAVLFKGGEDDAMEERDYDLLDGQQNLHARLQTLVNIVKGVANSKLTEPAFHEIEEKRCRGMVSGCWKHDGDRDNRGKVYLYFSPEDMTVALDNVRGIGWQGVPDYIKGTQLKFIHKSDPGFIVNAYVASHAYPGQCEWVNIPVTCKPLADLGTSFFQRVFTARHRIDPKTKKSVPELVGQAPHDYALRINGEDDQAHVARSQTYLRLNLEMATWPIDPHDSWQAQRYGIRTINGEALRTPIEPDLRGRQIDANKIPATSHLAGDRPADRGPCQELDPIEAAKAVGESGQMSWKEEVPDPDVKNIYMQDIYQGKLMPLSGHDCARIEADYNKNKLKLPDNAKPDQHYYKITSANRYPDGTVVAEVQPTPDAARMRWQNDVGEKSFHSAIFDNRKHHRGVTAYDLAIGSGRASSHPWFYKYLCAVADWRLKIPEKKNDRARPGILTWAKFLEKFSVYYACEPPWRKALIEGNVEYYSKGGLPRDLPLLKGKLWDIVVSETTSGKKIVHTEQKSRP
jgi:Protein of unknown function (DUF3274)